MTMPDPITRLNAALSGRYRIERQLGEGGMATVYLADDVRHDRRVALKVLKPELAAVVGAERFLAEIKTTANLQHPHILPLFDSGEADTFLFYVMPYVEGETLRDRLNREHQLPVGVAVEIARRVAAALEAAHQKGVIHRDIKPANILLSKGEPLVSDFGIALAVGAAGAGRLTETGLSLGTPHYMSPEQATGDQSVGAATDIYALGCVLYEMLVGEPPYTGSTPQAVLGKIVTGDAPSPIAGRRSVPPHVDAAIRKALEKVPADRFAGAGAFAVALDDAAFRYGEGATHGATRLAGQWTPLAKATTATTLVLAMALGWSLLRSPPPAPVARFPSPFAEGQAPIPFSIFQNFTPDGSALLYASPGPDGTQQLRLRRWSELDAAPVRGTEGVLGPVVISPDGRDAAFDVAGGIRVVSLDGGPGRTLVDEPVSGVSDWGADGMVYFTTAGSFEIHRVAAQGGGSGAVEEVVTERREGEIAHAFFTLLPGGRMGVFQVWHLPSGEDAEVWVVDLATGERRFLIAGSAPRYTASGHLLFATYDGVLLAAPFDAAAAELTGPAVPVADGLARTTLGYPSYAVSSAGALLYQVGGALTEGLLEAVWVTRSGDLAQVGAGLRFEIDITLGYGLRLSPDGRRVAFPRLLNANTDIWIKELPDGPLERLTVDDEAELYPFWSPDGQTLTYARGSLTSGDFDVWRSRADGSGSPELVLDHERGFYQVRWSPDGEWLILRTLQGLGAPPERDIFGFRPGLDTTLVSLAATTEFAEGDPELSPNGRWLAYTSDRSGRNEIYVSPFPDVGARRVQVSTGGGMTPHWAHSGDELFFVDTELRLVAAQVEADADFRILQRESLFRTPGDRNFISLGADWYDVAPDDQRFLMITLGNVTASAAGAETRFVLVENFFEELERLAPN